MSDTARARELLGTTSAIPKEAPDLEPPIITSRGLQPPIKFSNTFRVILVTEPRTIRRWNRSTWLPIQTRWHISVGRQPTLCGSPGPMAVLTVNREDCCREGMRVEAVSIDKVPGILLDLALSMAADSPHRIGF